jgi:hypothetical protein
MPIERADGITESERYLKRLCDQTFLSLWSYSGVYSDEGLLKNKQGKEVCDLLVVFENHIIIFSDKNCQFSNNGNLNIDWKRWFKKSIKKSAQQLWGAEKWIKKYPNHLFLDNLCIQRFPLYIPDVKTAKFHLIAVARGSSDRCRQEFGGTGNLKIKTFIKGSSRNLENIDCSPFYIGDIDPDQTFVHILDDVALDSVLITLDTVSDFVAYLTKKEELLRLRCDVSAASELELLAHYHKFISENGERDFFVPSNLDGQKSELILKEGYWEEFEKSPERKAKLEKDRLSYQWDELIKRISHYLLREELYFTSNSSISEQEILLRFLARENRFHRRMLAETLCDLVYSAPTDGTITARYVHPLSSKGVCYVFMVFPHLDWMAYEEYRQERRAALRWRYPLAKLRFPDAQHIIGVATETLLLSKEGRSEDAIHVDVTKWTSEDEVQAQQINEELSLSQDLKIFQRHYEDYPVE